MTEKQKETKDLSLWEVSFIFLIGLGIGSFIMWGFMAGINTKQLEKAYRTNITDWEFRYVEEDTIYLGTDFELVYEHEPYTVKLYVDWNFKYIYLEVYIMERLNYD